MYIRDEIPNGMVRDLSHSVAHTSRDRGYAYDRIEKFVSQMIDAFQNGGALEIKPIIEVHSFLKELCRNHDKLGVQLDRARTYRHREPLPSRRYLNLTLSS
jgi:hypothetical protein